MHSTPAIFAIWKPNGPTSHDIVDTVRRITGERRVGHAGTLDPMAEGVLVIGIGREATRRLKDVVGQEKEYVATIRLGATSTTDDAEGVIEISNLKFHISDSDITQVLAHFLGRIRQVPPAYSAVKVRGKPAHRRMRRGETVQLEPRIVQIMRLDLLRYAWPALDLRIVCGPGTYIRALARDIGRALGTGGYLAALHRTRVGPFTTATARTLEAFAEEWRGNAG